MSSCVTLSPPLSLSLSPGSNVYFKWKIKSSTKAATGQPPNLFSYGSHQHHSYPSFKVVCGLIVVCFSIALYSLIHGWNDAFYVLRFMVVEIAGEDNHGSKDDKHVDGRAYAVCEIPLKDQAPSTCGSYGALAPMGCLVTFSMLLAVFQMKGTTA